jgi:hypothetical protein
MALRRAAARRDGRTGDSADIVCCLQVWAPVMSWSQVVEGSVVNCKHRRLLSSGL